MYDRFRLTRLVYRPLLAGVLAVVLAACATAPGPDDATDRLSPQASGSFSGGSLSRGSVEGFFEGVGLGNTEHRLELAVDGVLWFECENNGGNLAPGQFAVTLAGQTTVEGTIDSNGRFEESVRAEGHREPTDDDCKNNWTVATDGDGEPVTFLQVVDDEADSDPYAVVAELFEVQDDGSLSFRDTMRWSCDDPEPTHPLDAYDPPPLTGENGVCTLVEDSA